MKLPSVPLDSVSLRKVYRPYPYDKTMDTGTLVPLREREPRESCARAILRRHKKAFERLADL